MLVLRLQLWRTTESVLLIEIHPGMKPFVTSHSVSPPLRASAEGSRYL